MRQTKVALDRVGVEEIMRGLDEKQFRILGEIAGRPLKEIGRRNMVSIKDGDQVGRCSGHGGGQVAGLG